MLRVGLTGGVASGKSAVAHLLAARGAATLDADEVVAALYRAGGEGTARVATLFGRAVLTAEGAVDRRTLAARVLADTQARRALEAAIHPLVRREMAHWFAALLARPHPPLAAVVEAALLVESGAFRDVDAVVVVEAPLALRRQRALAAGWTAGQFEAPVLVQASADARRQVADFVLVNDGDARQLETRVAQLWAWLAERAAPTMPT